MATPSFTDAALAIGGRIGRYFGIVSMLPSLFLVLWTYALLRSGAWAGTPDPGKTIIALGHWNVIGIAWLLAVTLLVALLLHPLQFAMTQLLEGYWGASRIAVRLARIRILAHRRRERRLLEQEGDQEKKWRDGADRLLDKWFQEDVASGEARPDEKPAEWSAEDQANVLDNEPGDPFIGHLISQDAAHRLRERYPEDGRRIMPTRLGNALRGFEDSAGRQYGLDAIRTAPHLLLIAPDRHVQYLRDSREQLDTAVRLCLVSCLATVVTCAFLLTDGFALLLALVPYAMAYIAYRAAVSAVDEYATAVRTVIDLDRFALYESLRITQPRSSAEERTTNTELMRLLNGELDANLRYRRDTSQQAGPIPRRPNGGRA